MLKRRLGLSGAIVLSALIGGCASPEPSDADIATLCRMTLDNYYIETDRGNWDVLKETFSADAEVTLLDQAYAPITYSGLEELTAYFEARNPPPNIIHHLTSASFEKTGSNTASGVVYILLHGELPVSTGESKGAIYSGFYEDEYRVEGGACKITKRKLNTKFVHLFAG